MAHRNHNLYDLGQTAAKAHYNANEILGAPFAEGGLSYMVYTIPKGESLIGTNGRLNPNAVLGNRIANNGNIYTLYPDNWLKEGLRTGFRQEYNATLSSANDRYSFYASLGYLDADGISYGNDIERYSARLKADVQAYSFLKVGASASYNHTVTNAQGNVFSSYTNIAPVYPLYIRDAQGYIMEDTHGRVFDYGDAATIGLSRPMDAAGNYIQEDLLNESKNNSNAFNIQGYATVDFLSDFHFTVNGSVYTTENRMNYAYNPYYGYQAGRGNVAVYHYRTTDFNTQQLLNYSKAFGQHSLDVLLGHEYTRSSWTGLNGSRFNPAFYEYNKELDGAIIDAGMGSYKSMYNVEGWFLRAQYDYESKYFVSGSFRRDGSSRFHPKHRWGNFWSLGAAWIATKEEWWPKSELLNMLKVKLSYGEQGNDQIGEFRYTDYYDIINIDGKAAFVFNSKGNENITWETVGSLNAGIEFELFNSRISGGLEFYSRTTRDMLMFFQTPVSLGYSGYYDNVGDMRNTGLELQLNADVISTRNFTWNLGLNLTWERNRVTSLPEEKKLATCDGYKGYLSGSLFYGEGLPVYTWRLRRYAGVNDNGQALFYYTDSDGKLATTTSYESADYYLCGSALPKVFGGFNTSFKFFGIDLSAQFNYSIGGKKYDGTYATFMTPPYGSLTGMPFHKDVLSGWSPENPNSNIPMWKYGNMTDANTSDRFLTDASYIGLRNITLGYTFPKAVLKALHMQQLRIFCQAENVYYWSKRKGFDPRMGALSGNITDSDGNSFPMRTISGGLTVEF